MNSRNIIRFDWAIKRLLRNKADYTVLEGFLTELLKEKIEIEDILESESNQISEEDKFNRVDILVKNSKGEFVIIEIQNQKEYDYFHRMLYGTSKVIAEYLKLGQPYRDVKKVYSVNIVYFDLGQGDDYVYHGKTDFHGIHQNDKLTLSPKQKELLTDKSYPYQLFPEFYVIKVNQFDNHAKDTLDQWIYYFKNDDIKEEFTAKGIGEARKLWRVDRLSEEEKKNYVRHMENLSYKASIEWTMKIDAEDKVRKDEKVQIAKSLKENGADIELIMKSTGLSRDEIENL
ncbi:Rpn family recombination-promoting nuclease/putative transposase [Flammeovirga aprica]|uniref:Rpn family recombination-promoting nuclease/putative transposase n=1 Tax=Flammeovirga aprica JL-4 TaxID=694437 RepID=A0A7X9P213_9BACT|nr:Rpn family recombination-promoting nuclease/putative transposase [Flammeovirga aprica]NME67567.1 Rpn family recombination-promoting nuclease/putative transposase [Flammeovirga aprica JL-4]